MAILIPISIGELYDKITILQIKSILILDDTKLKNINYELSKLNDIANENIINSDYIDKLYDVNKKLWIVEDSIRIKETKNEYDEEFINLARSVYYLNDERSEIKRIINVKYNSEFIEEKSYEKY